MFGLGFSEIIFLAVLALIIIGPKQLPEVARTIGRFINDLKRTTEGLKSEFKTKVEMDLNQTRKEVSDKIKAQQQELLKKEQSESSQNKQAQDDTVKS